MRNARILRHVPVSAAALLLAATPLVARAASLGEVEFLGNVTVQSLIGNVIRGFFGITGSVALVMFVYGGFVWMTASGNEEKIKKAKNTVVWSAIGLFAMFFAYAIANLILYYLQQASS